MNDAAWQPYSGKAQVDLCRRLGDNWRYLALSLEIPAHEYDRFEKGDEGWEILRWLEQRERLDALPDALEHIGRPELALILKPPSAPSVKESRWQKGSPYPGLRPLTAKDAPVFFGRDRNTAALIAKLEDPGNRFLTVVGASGSDKSSLVAVGLLPADSSRLLPRHAFWFAVRVRWKWPTRRC